MEIHGLEEYFNLEDEGEDLCLFLADAGGATVTENHQDEGKGVYSITKGQVLEVEEDLMRRESRERRRDMKMRRGIRKTLSNNCEKLEHLYSSRIEVGSKKQRQYFNLLKFVMNILVVQMKQVSWEFSKSF